MLISVHFKLIKQNKSTAMRCMDNTALPCRMSPTFSLLPQRAVPVSGTRSQGGYSLLKRECPPRPPKEKRGGISISPRTPLKRHKGRGPWPPAFGNQPPRGRGTRARSLPFGNPSQGDGGRGQGPSPLETPLGDGGAAAERGAGGVLFAPRCAPCPQMRRRTDLRFRYSAAGRGVSSSVSSS